MVRLTKAQARTLGANLDDALPKGPPGRKRDLGPRAKTVCVVCGETIHVSPGQGRSFGWARNWGWCDAPPNAMVPAHLDCREARWRQVYEGEYSI